MAIKPNVLFQVWRPDEVAECLDGVPQELYIKLWNELVPIYDKKAQENIEDRGPEVDYTLSEYWDKLTEEEQTLLNQLAVKHTGQDAEERWNEDS